MTVSADGYDRGEAADKEILCLIGFFAVSSTNLVLRVSGSSIGSSKTRSSDDIAARSPFWARPMALSRVAGKSGIRRLKKVRFHGSFPDVGKSTVELTLSRLRLGSLTDDNGDYPPAVPIDSAY
jgi:hypothetical protein